MNNSQTNQLYITILITSMLMSWSVNLHVVQLCCQGCNALLQVEVISTQASCSVEILSNVPIYIQIDEILDPVKSYQKVAL